MDEIENHKHIILEHMHENDDLDMLKDEIDETIHDHEQTIVIVLQIDEIQYYEIDETDERECKDEETIVIVNE